MKSIVSPRMTVALGIAGVASALLLGLGWAAAAALGAATAAGLAAFALALLACSLGVLLLEQRARSRVESTLAQTRQQLDRAQADVRRVGADMQRLAQFSEQLQSCRSLDEIAEVLTVAMRGLLPQFDGALYLQAPGRNVVTRHAMWGKPPAPFDEMFTPDDCWAVRRGVLYPNGDGKSPGCKHLAEGAVPEYTLCAPLKSGDGTFGTLHFSGSAPPSGSERRLAQNIADQLALTLMNLRLQDQLRVQQVRDPLTNLFNRRHLDGTLLRELLRARRRNQTVALLMIDLDQFKRFTDRHGHDVGDVALAQVASQIEQTVRQDDVACRYGGEEFVVLMPDTGIDAAREQAEAIRRAVKAAHIDFHGRRLEVITVSVGVAVFPQHGAEPTLLLRAADKALNAAKEAGRDQVAVADNGEDAPSAQAANG